MDGSMGGGCRFVTRGIKGWDDVSSVRHKPYNGGAAAPSNSHGLLCHWGDCPKDAEELKPKGVKFVLEPNFHANLMLEQAPPSLLLRSGQALTFPLDGGRLEGA